MGGYRSCRLYGWLMPHAEGVAPFPEALHTLCVAASVGVLEYSACTRVQLEYHFLSTRTRNPRYSVGTRTRRSMYSVLGQKKRRVHEYIWSSLKVINKMNF